VFSSSPRRVAACQCVAYAAVVLAIASPALSQQNSGLPPGFQPAQQPPKVLTLENELITAEEVAAWKKTRLKYFDALRENQLTDDSRATLIEGMRVQIYHLTVTDERNGLTKVRTDLLRDFDRECRNSDVRAFVLDEIQKRTLDVLDGNFHVRCQAAMLLGKLDVSPEKPGLQPVPAVAWTGSVPPLLDVIDPPNGGTDQPEAVRILAARSIERILQLGRQTLPPNSKLLAEAARRILSQLTKPGSDWYHARLVLAIVQTGVDMVPDAKNVPKPLIVDALARIIANPKRSYAIRAKAAFALGRAQIPNGVQADPIAFVLVKLAQQMALDVNQGRLSSTQALFRFQDVYRGFQRSINEPENVGLLATLKRPSITSAYGDIRPLFQAIMRASQLGAPAAFPPDLIQKLGTWQPPASMAIDPNGQPITQPLQSNVGTANPTVAGR